MMEDIQFIVEKLNEAPFKKNLRLVDFDEKTPIELLQVLNDVFSELEPAMATDVRDEQEDLRLQRMVSFLTMLKFQVDDTQRSNFQQGLMYGDKAVVYPILHWCLQRIPQLQKRAYLARYLMPVDVPAEYFQDDTLADLMARLKELQEEFKLVHKSVDQLRGSNLRPGDLRNEITQLEDEKNQLTEKIAKLQRSTQGEQGFEAMLKVTSELRQEQEEEARLMEKMRDQRQALQQSDGRGADASKRLASIRQSTSGSGSANAILEQLQKEVRELQGKLADTLPRELAEKQAMLQKLEQARMQPQKTRDDVEELNQLSQRMERECAAMREKVEKTLQSRGEERLLVFRQHASLASTNRAAKEDEYEKLTMEKAQLGREIEDKESKMSDMSGPKFMSKEEFKQYCAKLKDKTQTYKRLKQELAELRAESVVLHRTEAILRSRDKNLDDFLRKLELKQGVSGFRETQEKLEKASEQTAQIDAQKGSTLEDISRVVQTISLHLREKKVLLQPQIKALKEARKRFQEVENVYFQKRSNYEKVAVGLEVDRQQLEQECDAFQEECLREESRYHYLHALTSIMDANLEKVKMEEKWESGDGRLLPDFKTYKELYQNKIAQQEGLSKQLRKQQKGLKENEAVHSEQRKHFMDLKALLALKMRVMQSAANKQSGGFNIGARMDPSEYDGGSNILTFDQGGDSKYN